MADALAYANKYLADDPIEKLEMSEGSWNILFRSGQVVYYDLGMMRGGFGFPNVMSRLSVEYQPPIA